MSRFVRFASRVMSSLLRAWWEVNDSRRIKLSRAMYFQIPDLNVRLFSGILDDTQSMRLTLPEAAAIFRSIGDAVQSNELRTVKIGELEWTTDTRAASVVIDIKGPLGSRHVSVSHEDVAAALMDFDKKVLLKLTTMNTDQNDRAM